MPLLVVTRAKKKKRKETGQKEKALLDII